MKTAELNIKRMTLTKLIPHPKNPRIHPEPGTPQWETLKKSLESDYFDPIVVNVGKTEPSLKNTLVSGHLRTKVLIESGFKQADCVMVDYDGPTHTARMLAANRLAGQDDDAAVFALLKDLQGTELSLAGFDEDSFKRLLAAEEIPPANKSIDEEALAETNCECPKCGFKWKK